MQTGEVSGQEGSPGGRSDMAGCLCSVQGFWLGAPEPQTVERQVGPVRGMSNEFSGRL